MTIVILLLTIAKFEHLKPSQLEPSWPYIPCQTWILAPDIGEYPAKNRVISDESYFTTDTVFLSGSGFSFYEHFNSQFTHAVFSYSKPYDVFEQKYFIPLLCCFLALLGTASPLKTFYMSLHSTTKNLKKI